MTLWPYCLIHIPISHVILYKVIPKVISLFFCTDPLPLIPPSLSIMASNFPWENPPSPNHFISNYFCESTWGKATYLFGIFNQHNHHKKSFVMSVRAVLAGAETCPDQGYPICMLGPVPVMLCPLTQPSRGNQRLTL